MYAVRRYSHGVKKEKSFCSARSTKMGQVKLTIEVHKHAAEVCKFFHKYQCPVREIHQQRYTYQFLGAVLWSCF